ncbi:PTH1R [Branchiostoma lanceolatum]|uniref:PTH1R protein n=1 Tax=Branchiostoma lanceolatum TaxID=7740 RepID=A0A8J9W3Q4_BRALA|nr:PTH1R [Branchiostoma lanceolatum]
MMQLDNRDVYSDQDGRHGGLCDTMIWCKIVVTLYNYFIAANYFWLLVEGLFLHSLIAVGFFSERKYFRWYMVLGWGTPWLFMIPWIAVRVAVQDKRTCWGGAMQQGLNWERDPASATPGSSSFHSLMDRGNDESL